MRRSKRNWENENEKANGYKKKKGNNGMQLNVDNKDTSNADNVVINDPVSTEGGSNANYVTNEQFKHLMELTLQLSKSTNQLMQLSASGNREPQTSSSVIRSSVAVDIDKANQGHVQTDRLNDTHECPALLKAREEVTQLKGYIASSQESLQEVALLKAQLTASNEELTVLKARVEELKENNKQIPVLKEEITTLNEEVASQKKNNKQLRESIKSYHNNNKNLSQNNKFLLENNRKLFQKNTILESTIGSYERGFDTGRNNRNYNQGSNYGKSGYNQYKNQKRY